MIKNRRLRLRFIWTGVGLAALAAALAIPLVALRSNDSGPMPWAAARLEKETLNLDDEGSLVLPLVMANALERMPQLEAIANQALDGATASARPTDLDRHRARYLLAVDLIEQGKGGQALPLLENLEADYPVMAAPILYQRAKAQTASGDTDGAKQTWEQLLTEFPDSPKAAEALYALGRWDEAIARFPSHPRSLEIAETRLAENPNQPDMLLLIARHGLYRSDYIEVLDRLKTEYGDQLTPEDWEALGYGYWEKWYYGSAGSAYEKAPATSLNRYRAGRGAQLGQRNSDAIAAYKRLIEEFPESEDTAQGLIRLAELVDSEEAIGYLDRVIEQYPDRAGEALLARARQLDTLQSSTSAKQARESVLSQYSDSDAAAELRWQRAEAAFETGDLKTAWTWAGELVTNNPDSDLAPEAAFWVGKWAKQMGQDRDAEKAFKHVLRHYPESYYAWRSAVYLGWDVGDFTTVRTQIPAFEEPDLRATLPAGSDTLSELYRLGQGQDAWAMWQVEFQNPRQPTVVEQFTDGVMRLEVGDHLDGIFMLDSLDWRPEDVEDSGKADYEALRQSPAYWQFLYPAPFQETILSWSTQRRLNPLLVTALIRQESRFEPAIKSVAGATGLMQVMPGTADWIAQQISLSDYKMSDPNDNIKLGTWYLDYTHREYSDNSLFAVASYNAGPGNVADWINRFGIGDPDEFVEQIPFPETKGYVESVFENYWNYLRIYDPAIAQKLAEYSPEQAKLIDNARRPEVP